jgi:hypothetical protein
MDSWSTKEAVLLGSPKPEKISRRKALKISFGGLALSFLGGDTPHSSEREPAVRQPSELFDMRVSGLERSYASLGGDEILFVDEYGRPIGAPVKLEPINGISPGIMKNGALRTRIQQRWLDTARTRFCREVPGTLCDIRSDIPRQLNVLPAMREAILDTPEEDIHPRNYMDIIRHYGRKRVIGGGGLDRIAYIRAHIRDTMHLPERVEDEVAFLSLGVAAQESFFNNDKISPDGARGIFQFMPDTWEALGYTDADRSFLVPQVRAAGKHFSNILKELNEGARPQLAHIKAIFFNGDEEAFQKFFIAPLIVNAYNAGGSRMAAITKWFSRKYPDKNAFDTNHDAYPHGYGYDFFKRLADEARTHADTPRVGSLFSRYKNDAPQYFFRSMALARLLNQNRTHSS